MMQTQFTDSAFQAQAILGAWQTGDDRQFLEELNRVNGLPASSFDSAEAERLELLAAIAGELRVSVQPFGVDSSTIYCHLLQHLAYPGMPDSAAILPQPAKGGWAPAAMLLQ